MEIKLKNKDIKKPVTAKLVRNVNLIVGKQTLQKGNTYTFDADEFNNWYFRDMFVIEAPKKAGKK